MSETSVTKAEFKNQRNLGLLRPVSNDPAGTTYHVSSGIRCRHAHENLVIKVVYGVLPRALKLSLEESEILFYLLRGKYGQHKTVSSDNNNPHLKP